MIATPINETLPANASTAALIELPDTMSCSDYAIQARGSVDLWISDTEAMTKRWTIKAGTAQALSQVLGPGTKLFYAKSGSTEDVIEVLPLKA